MNHKTFPLYKTLNFFYPYKDLERSMPWDQYVFYEDGDDVLSFTSHCGLA